MPNTRRRRFSVQHDIADSQRVSSKPQRNPTSTYTDTEFETSFQNLIGNMPNKHKNKFKPDSSRNVSSLEVVAECESSPSTTKADKDVTASSSNIDLYTAINAVDYPADQSNEMIRSQDRAPKKRDARQTNRDHESVMRRDKPRQHRVKVRSPKRRIPTPERDHKSEENKTNMGTDVIDWDQESEVYIEHVNENNVIPNVEEEARTSNHSIEDMCRICHGGDALSPEVGQMISACSCRGTVGRVHVKCLERWLTESGKSRCELCGTRYHTRRVHRYGVPRALVMWVMSQNAKQLMVDSLGIMLMSPLAVLAAWLSGRTLAGLMTQDSRVTPWPLASTFVLACMTLPLLDILSKSAQGKNLLKLHKEEGLLSNYSRRQICNIIVQDLLADDPDVLITKRMPRYQDLFKDLLC